MTILIDRSVGSKDLISIPPLDQVSILTNLHSGDASFKGNYIDDKRVRIGIEIKTVSDLVASSRSKRLQDVQIPRMLKQYHSSWVVFYGIYRPGRTDEGVLVYHEKRKRWEVLRLGKWAVPYTYLQGIVIRLSEMGIHVYHVPTKLDVAEWVYRIYLSWQKNWNEHSFMEGFKKPVWTKKDVGRETDEDVLRVARTAASLKGVNYRRGIAAANYFGSVHKMINATVLEWEKVEGIGRTLALKLHEEMHKEIR